MRFFYVTNEALDHRSVQTIHVDAICKALASLGHDVTLYAPRASAFPVPRAYSSSFIRVPGVLSSVFFQARLLFRLLRDIRHGRPDVIYSRHDLLLFVPALVGKLAKLPLVLEVNGPLLDEAKSVNRTLVGRTLLASGVFRTVESFSARRAWKIVVVAPGIREYLVRNHGIDAGKVFVVANGVDPDRFRPLDRLRMREKLGLEQETFYVGYIGSLYPWQGVHYIVEAAARVLDSRRDTNFLIIGKGDELPALSARVEEAGISDSVTIIPPVPHEHVPEYVNALDVCLCYPTRFRANTTSPFKVYEYLACGKAVILADIEGMREAFADTVDYAEPEDAAALAARIDRLLDDETLRNRIGGAGLAFIRGEQTWAKVAERLVAISGGARVGQER